MLEATVSACSELIRRQGSGLLVQVLRDLHHALISRLRPSMPVPLVYSWLPGWWPSGRDEVRGGRLRGDPPIDPGAVQRAGICLN